MSVQKETCSWCGIQLNVVIDPQALRKKVCCGGCKKDLWVYPDGDGGRGNGTKTTSNLGISLQIDEIGLQLLELLEGNLADCLEGVQAGCSVNPDLLKICQSKVISIRETIKII